MATPKKKAEKKPAVYLAEFTTTRAIIHACEKTRAAGYTKFDTHTPFPIHGMDAAMGLKDSKLGWIVMPIGMTGTFCAWLMMWWMNGIDYPLVIGGKPPYSIPPIIPIMFEVTVLFSSFASVFGMFHLNKIPQHHHPVFTSDRFAGFSDDRFFLSIEAEDPKFDIEKTKKFLVSLHPEFLELVYDDDKTAEQVPVEASA